MLPLDTEALEMAADAAARRGVVHAQPLRAGPGAAGASARREGGSNPLPPFSSPLTVSRPNGDVGYLRATSGESAPRCRREVGESGVDVARKAALNEQELLARMVRWAARVTHEEDGCCSRRSESYCVWSIRLDEAVEWRGGVSAWGVLRALRGGSHRARREPAEADLQGGTLGREYHPAWNRADDGASALPEPAPHRRYRRRAVEHRGGPRITGRRCEQTSPAV